MQKVAVTGARGFIGRNLCTMLKGQGHSLLEIDLPEIDVTDVENLLDTLASYNPDKLYHLAGQASVQKSWEMPLETFRVNSGGTATLLEAVRRSGLSTRVLIASSASVYNGSNLRQPIAESVAINPSSPYGTSKLIAERLAHVYSSEYGLDIVLVRPFNIIGPGQTTEYVVPAIAKRIVAACNSNRSNIEIGSMLAVRDFLDARDAVRAMSEVMAAGKTGRVYNVCSGVGVSISDVAYRLIELTGCDIALKPVNSLHREHDRSYVVGDPSLIRRELGWVNRVTLDESLNDILEEWREKVSSFCD